MQHSKLIGFQTAVERIARVAGAAYDIASRPQTAPSGSISYDNADGTRTIIGPQAGAGEEAPGGQAIATHVGDTTPPPVPAGIKAWSGDGYLHISWDGTLADAIPADFLCINILANGSVVSRMQHAGSVTVEGLEAGSTVSVTATSEDDACLADGTPAHNISAPCAAISVTIRDMMAEAKATADTHESQIDAIQKDIEAYKKSATATYATKTEVNEQTGAITKTIEADYTKTTDMQSAIADAQRAAEKAAAASTDSKLLNYNTWDNTKYYINDNFVGIAPFNNTISDAQQFVAQTYAEKTELTEAVNQLSSTMTSNYSAFTDYRTSNDTALSKAQTDATNAQSTIDSYKQSNDRAVADAKSAGTTAQDQLSAYKNTNDAAVAAAKKAGTDAQADLNGYRSTTNQRLDSLQNIADNAIESWYEKGAPTASNPPASTWTTDALKKQHAGDLYMDTSTGYTYRWSGTAWIQVKDSDVTKALTEIASIKTDYATKTELEQTNTSLSAKVEDSLSTAKTYASGLVSTEVTQRNAAITAKANEISQQVSKTYTKSETFSAYQSDADSRIATANSNASTAKSTAQAAATDAATAKTNASTAVSTANSAKSTAQTASTNASDAVSTANSANSKSDSAVSTANSAKSTAASASSTANAAKSTVDSMKLGGRNLLKGTSMDSKAVTTPTTASTTWGSGFAFPADAALHAVIPYGAEYRCSADVLLPVDGTIVVDMNTFAESGTSWAGNDNDNDNNKRTATRFNVKANIWTRISWGGENTSAANTGKQAIYVNDSVGLLPQSAAVTWHYRGLKVELGNKATDWTPAPEDTDSAVADAKKAGTDAQTSANNAQKAADKAASDLAAYKTQVTQTYSTKAELKSTSDSLTASVNSNYTKATSYADGKVAQEVKDRNSAINAKADAINLAVKSEYATQDALAESTYRIVVASAPVQDDGSGKQAGKSVLTAHVYAGNDEIAANAIAKIGIVKWYVDGASTAAATGTTYTAAAGAKIVCRLEA